MHDIHLSAELFQSAQRQSVAAGFASVDDFVAEVLSQNLAPDTPNLDYLFTPERLALIEQSAAMIDAGQGITLDNARQELANRRH